MTDAPEDRSAEGGERGGGREPQAAPAARPRPGGGTGHAARKQRETEQVRVVVTVSRRVVDDLGLIIEYRHGGRCSRSAVVREAMDWLIARESEWLARARHAADKRARAAALEDLVAQVGREEADRRRRDDLIDEALQVARGRRSNPRVARNVREVP